MASTPQTVSLGEATFTQSHDAGQGVYASPRLPVRGVKGIADLFIGTLNSADGRMALKQKITEFFLGMEKEGAIVPSIDGTEPSFKVDVYSSEQDFGQGIVRVDIAVRPVRAIDYIYATITVEV